MTYQVPPCRLPESPKPAGMTIKHDIEREAEKLGAVVRAAVEEFARETGMQASIDIEWVSMQMLQDPANTNQVGYVRVEVGGLSVEA
ncbi:MAG: hypothetical protein WBC18_14755 [Ottowia sp.]|uniref:hypothetical protein n=1 Tax=Ottowia sp. TaxID=1898956 RepID=UPI003C72883D